MTPEQRARVEALFSQLVDLKYKDREPRLRDLCPDDPEVRDEVLRLLRSDEEQRTAFSERIRESAAWAITEDRDPMIGTSVGPYKILAVLGEGGFGIVYLADQRQPVQRQVALKIIKPGMGSRGVIARFEQERQALAIMDHPNVARVFDGGITPDGRPYFVMELVKGSPITDFADRERLTIQQRLELFIPVCDAVQHAHTKGIIHRDLKPSNILVIPAESSTVPPRPKVIDFGVAKAISHTLCDKTIFTERGQIIGTPEYMSPEQAEMGATDIDTRTDVYSLGVVLYELVTGLLPFDPKALRAAGYAEIQRIIREVDPPRPSARLTSVGESSIDIARRRHEQRDSLVRILRRELEWIPLMAMRKNRAMRYRTPAELADDIRNYLGGQPLIAGPESRRYRARKFARKHRVFAATSTIVSIAIISAAVISLWFAASERKQRRIAENALRQASLERDVAKSVEEFLNDDLLGAPDPEREGPEVLVVTLLDSAAARLSQRLNDQPGFRARVSLALGRAYINVGAPARGIPLLENAAKLFETDPTATEDLAETRLSLTEARWRTADANEAISLIHQHIATLKSGPDEPALLEARNQLGGALKKAGKLDEALAIYTDVAARRARVLGPTHADTLITEYDIALVHLAYGEAHKKQGRDNDAVTAYNESLRLMQAVLDKSITSLGADNPVTIPMFSELASLLNRLNRIEEAEAAYARAAPSIRKVLGSRHLRTHLLIANWATLKAKNPSPDALRTAAALYEEALLGFHELNGPMHSYTLSITLKLADVCAALEEHKRCLWLMERGYTEALDAGLDRKKLSDFAEACATTLERRGLTSDAATWKARATSTP